MSSNWWLDKLWFSHTMKYYSAINRTELLIHTTWINVKCIKLNQKTSRLLPSFGNYEESCYINIHVKVFVWHMFSIHLSKYKGAWLMVRSYGKTVEFYKKLPWSSKMAVPLCIPTSNKRVPVLQVWLSWPGIVLQIERSWVWCLVRARA